MRIGLLPVLLNPILMLITGIKYRPDVVQGIYFVPYGMFSVLIGCLLQKPVGVSLIGGRINLRLRSAPTLWRKTLMAFLKRANRITVTGKRSLEEVVATGIPRDKIRTLPNAVDTQRFTPPDQKEPLYDLIFVANLIPRKRPDLFLELAARVKQSRDDFKALVVGDGPEKERLLHQVRGLGISDQVTFAGHVSHTEDHLHRSRLFVLPTRLEGLPVAAIEAMACGIPCVISNVNDISDLVRTGENGILVDDFSDIEAVAGAITDLLDDEEEYSRLSSNAVQSVVEGYSMSAASRVWQKILGDIE
jgi:glycosyltransferase involved in cell wall biosynthesis